MRRFTVAVLAVLIAAAPLAGAHAQSTEQRLRANRDELEKIRRERDDLQRRLVELQGEARDISAEVINLRRQADATARLVRSLDAQLHTITVEVDSANVRLARAEQDVARKKSALQQRVVEIYKRGPLYTVEALLSARSFGELVSRYKYLHELALWDRSLVNRVETLFRQVTHRSSYSLGCATSSRTTGRKRRGRRTDCGSWSAISRASWPACSAPRRMCKSA